MSRPTGIPPENQTRPFPEALRWLVAVCVASAVTVGLLFMMTGLVDPSSIVMHLVRLYPLTQAAPCPEEGCATPSPVLPVAVTIEGSVGYRAEGRIMPLGAAEIVAERPNGKNRKVEVDADGKFQFVTGWPIASPSPPGSESRRRGSSTPQLLIRAPGCTERRVPVTRAWIPRLILLSCTEPG
ncbi:MAG: hypothetical protein JRG96_14230 [Deltaproteobacteria bacterium]|nr:hypothetical protein [Deltaproteobacteria bacterium]MBW2418259.1 hypothetical protein [Deltaproteobacteria bacterium]